MILSHGESLIEAILPELEGAGRDYSGNLVVFPGKRPSHFLRKSLSRQLGGSFIPPVILSMDEFIDRICDSGESGSHFKMDALDGVSTLYVLHKKARNPLGGELFMTPDSFFPLGMKLYRDLEELLIEGVSSRKVKEIDALLAEDLPRISAGRLQTLSYFFEEFYSWLDSRGMSTRSSRYRTASETLTGEDLSSFRKVVFAGFYAFTRSEKVLLRKMFSWDKVVLFFQDGPGIKERLADLGIEAASPAEAVEPEVRLYRSPDTHGQVFALGSLLRKEVEEGIVPDENSVIVLPLADTLFPLLYHGLGYLDQNAYNISLGYPLHRTPVYGFLNSLMELISSMDGSRFFLPDYLNFILHPYTKNISFNGSSEITRVIFHTLEEGLTGSRTRAFFDLSEVEDGEDFFRRICEKLSGTEPEVSEETLRGHLKAIHRNTIGRYHSFQDVGDFARKSIEILHYVFEASTARLHPLFSPFSEAFGQVFQTISKSLMKDTRFTETASYFTLFRKYLSSRYVPFDGTPVKGLQVLGVLETRGLSFDRVFVLDMNEEAFPDTRKEDSLLPYRVREALGLPTYRDRDRLAAYTFESLRRGAKEVHLFSIENDEKEKSRFVEKILWEKQKKDRETGSGRYFTSVRYRLQLRNAGPKEVRKSPEMTGLLRNLSYSATSLDTYLGCPLQFYYQYVLRTGPKEEATESIERADIGKFVHLVLSRFFERKKGHPLQEKDIDPDEMEGLVEDFFSREYGNDPVGAAYLLKGQVQAHLKRFLRDYTLPLIREHAVTVLHVEHNIKVTKNSFSLIGRLDQVEKWGERIRIVDYKTSSNSDALRIRSGKLDLAERETWGEAIGSLQLPFYLLLYSTISGKRPEELDALFLLLGRARISKEIEVPLLEREENPQEAFQRLESVIFRLLGEIVDPEVPFEPTRDRKGLCPGCDFRYLCGTQWIR